VSAVTAAAQVMMLCFIGAVLWYLGWQVGEANGHPMMGAIAGVVFFVVAAVAKADA